MCSRGAAVSLPLENSLNLGSALSAIPRGIITGAKHFARSTRPTSVPGMEYAAPLLVAGGGVHSLEALRQSYTRVSQVLAQEQILPYDVHSVEAALRVLLESGEASIAAGEQRYGTKEFGVHREVRLATVALNTIHEVLETLRSGSIRSLDDRRTVLERAHVASKRVLEFLAWVEDQR